MQTRAPQQGAFTGDEEKGLPPSASRSDARGFAVGGRDAVPGGGGGMAVNIGPQPPPASAAAGARQYPSSSAGFGQAMNEDILRQLPAGFAQSANESEYYRQYPLQYVDDAVRLQQQQEQLRRLRHPAEELELQTRRGGPGAHPAFKVDAAEEAKLLAAAAVPSLAEAEERKRREQFWMSRQNRNRTYCVDCLNIGVVLQFVAVSLLIAGLIICVIYVVTLP